MPTKKERMDPFKELVNSKGAKGIKYRRELTNMFNLLKKHNVGTARLKAAFETFDINNLKTDDDWNNAYEIFNHMMEASFNYAITRAYSKTMSKHFDAMVDDNNQGKYNRAHDPVIIFNGQKYLKRISVRDLSVDEVMNNYNLVRETLEKEGERVKL